MNRTAVIGNSGGWKSSLGRAFARMINCPYHDIDALLRRPGGIIAPVEDYETQHRHLIAQNEWVIDGFGRLESLPERLNRARNIFLIDMPLSVHFSLAAKSYLNWVTGKIAHPPPGFADMPNMDALFETIWTIDRDWMSKIRDMVAAEERAQKPVRRFVSVGALEEYIYGCYRSS